MKIEKAVIREKKKNKNSSTIRDDEFEDEYRERLNQKLKSNRRKQELKYKQEKLES